MSDLIQFTFFASLDFPGRTTLLLGEIAERLGCSVKHLCREIDSGTLVVLDIKTRGASRMSARVPVECYRDYVMKKLTGPMRWDLMKQLPREVRERLVEELRESLAMEERKF